MATLILLVSFAPDQTLAGGKGDKGGSDDIILYRGNIVMRGDEEGGNVVMANQQEHEEVEFGSAPYYWRR